jgi:hypothetical protein
MPQHELGKILGVSPETIKSVEGGRLRQGGLSRAIRDAAFIQFGALWQDETAEWLFFLTAEPYTRAHYDWWKSAAFDRASEIHASCLRLITLLQATRDVDFRAVIDTLDSHLIDVQERYGIKIKDPDFDAAEMDSLLPVWKDGVETGNFADIVGYRRSRPLFERKRKPKLFDFRAKLEKTEPLAGAGGPNPAV